MKTYRNLLAVFFALIASSLLSLAQAPKIVWELSKGVKAPESAYYHEKSGTSTCHRLVTAAVSARMETA